MQKSKIYIQQVVILIAFVLFSAWGHAQLTAQVGDTTTLSVSEVSSDTYTWELYDVSQNVNFATTAGNCPASKAQFVGGNIGNSVQVQWLVPGEYFYKVTAQNSCSNNIKIGRIVVLKTEEPPPPTVEIVYDCEKGVAKLIASNYTGSLLWSTGEDKESIIVSKGGTYTVVQIVNGIKSEPTVVKIIDSITPRVNLLVEAQPAVIEVGGESQLVAEGCLENHTLIWYADENLTEELTVTKVSPKETTTYYAVCENEVGCKSEAVSTTVTVKAVIPQTPEIAITYVCEEGIAILTAAGYEGTLLWSTGASTASITVTEGGEYTLVQTVAGQQSAAARITVGKIVPESPSDAKATPPKILKGGTAELTAESCENGTLRWYTDESLTEELAVTKVSPEETTTYYAVCENEEGCKSEAVAVRVEISPFDEAKCKQMYRTITIEQLVTPNNDGYNDTWELKDILKYCNECGKTAKVKLFNRWGTKVYEKDGYMLDADRFDGHSENSLDYRDSKRLPDGTYFYVIIVEGEKEKTGYINIITSE